MRKNPFSLCTNKRKCSDCKRYMSTVSGSIHNPGHGVKLFVCRECTAKRKAA